MGRPRRRGSRSASKPYVSLSTVKTDARRIFRKLGASGRTQAVTRGAGAGNPLGASVAERLVGDPGGQGVDSVMEGVDRDLLLRPEDRRRSNLERRQHHLRVTPDRGA